MRAILRFLRNFPMPSSAARSFQFHRKCFQFPRSVFMAERCACDFPAPLTRFSSRSSVRLRGRHHFGCHQDPTPLVNHAWRIIPRIVAALNSQPFVKKNSCICFFNVLRDKPRLTTTMCSMIRGMIWMWVKTLYPQ